MTQVRQHTDASARVVSMSNDIAFQTNMLALNAAVEAEGVVQSAHALTQLGEALGTTSRITLGSAAQAAALVTDANRVLERVGRFAIVSPTRAAVAVPPKPQERACDRSLRPVNHT